MGDLSPGWIGGTTPNRYNGQGQRIREIYHKTGRVTTSMGLGGGGGGSKKSFLSPLCNKKICFHTFFAFVQNVVDLKNDFLNLI